MLGATLLAIMIGIIAYDMPTAKTLNYWSLPLSGKVIAIDAGHGEQMEGQLAGKG